MDNVVRLKCKIRSADLSTVVAKRLSDALKWPKWLGGPLLELRGAKCDDASLKCIAQKLKETAIKLGIPLAEANLELLDDYTFVCSNTMRLQCKPHSPYAISEGVRAAMFWFNGQQFPHRGRIQPDVFTVIAKISPAEVSQLLNVRLYKLGCKFTVRNA